MLGLGRQGAAVSAKTRGMSTVDQNYLKIMFAQGCLELVEVCTVTKTKFSSQQSFEIVKNVF